MTICNLDFVKELVNAFNINNYGFKTNTNFIVKGDNIVGKFNCDEDSAKRYLSQMARDLVGEYFLNKDLASNVFDLGSFPFHFDKKWLKYDEKTRMTKLTVPIDSGVIFNLKVHFAEEFKNDVKDRMIKEIDKEKPNLGEENIKEALNASIKQAKMDPSSGCIKCLLFNSENVQKHFVMTLKAQMKEHGYNYLNFYGIDYEGKKIYFKDVENIGFVRSVTELSKKMAGYNFNFPSDYNLKVRSYKDAMSRLIFSLTGIEIYGYYYDEFIDKGRISSGDHFAFIPITKNGSNFRYLNYIEADKINAKFSHDILTNVRGQTEDTESDEFGEVYALSDRQIALLIPVIIENSVINKEGQIEIDPGLYEKLQAPPTKLDSPRRESGVLPHVRHNVGAAEVIAAQNVPAGPSDSSLWPSQSTFGNQCTPPMQFTVPGDSSQQKPLLQSSYVITSLVRDGIPRRPILLMTKNTSKFPSPEFSARSPCFEDVNILGIKSEEHDKSKQGACSQVGVRESLPLEGAQADDESMPIDSWSSPASSAELRQQSQVSSSGPSSSRGANESMRTRKSIWYVQSSYSPGVEDVNDVELKKQQVSESPKKHGSSFQKVKDFFSSPFKSKQRDAGLKRHNVGRDTTRSMTTISVTKKPPLSERFASERKAKSNPPSEVTSPTHEGAPGGLKPLTSDERKELRPFLSPELQKKLDSNSFSPGEERHLYLTHTLSRKRELSRSLCEGKESQLLRLAEAQLSSLDNSSSKKVDRDSGFCSMGSPAVPHKGSVSSKVKECNLRQAKYTSKALGKNWYPFSGVAE